MGWRWGSGSRIEVAAGLESLLFVPSRWMDQENWKVSPVTDMYREGEGLPKTSQ